jgi:hypothetical protein
MYNIEAHRIFIIMSKTISTATRYLIQKHWLLCICIFHIVDSSLIKVLHQIRTHIYRFISAEK